MDSRRPLFYAHVRIIHQAPLRESIKAHVNHAVMSISRSTGVEEYRSSLEAKRALLGQQCLEQQLFKSLTRHSLIDDIRDRIE